MVDDLRTQPDRDRVAELIAAADRLATPRDFEIIDRRPIRRGGVIAAIVVAGVLLGLVTITTLGGGGDATADDRIGTTAAPVAAPAPSDVAPTGRSGEGMSGSASPEVAVAASSVASATGAQATTSATTSSPTGPTAATSPTAATGPTAATSPTATTNPTATATASATSTDAAPVRYAVYSGGKVYLRGRVPDLATAATISGKAAAVVGAGNVVDEYVIDPDAPTPRGAPLYVADALLFEPDSNDLVPAGRGLVDLGIVLLQQNPGVTWIIEGHTDNLGSEEYNIELAQRRLDSIVEYITDHGIDPRRLTTIAKGESEPIADNATRDGRAQNRRLEVVIVGLLD